MKYPQIFLAFLLLSLCFLTCLQIIVAREEDIKVEKEGQPTPSNVDKVKTEKEPTNTQKYNKSSAKKRVKEMRNQFGNDWFDGFQDPFFGNNWLGGFDRSFSNLDRSFNQMRRRMNNMFGKSMLPSLFDDHQWWEDYTKTINSIPKGKQEESVSSSYEETSNEKPIVEMKRREPISSVLKNEQIDGKTQLSLSISNIPRDVFEKKDIDIKVQENSLGDLITIRGEKKTENGHFEFSKSYRFPKGSLDLEQVKASLSDEGILNVRIPRIGAPSSPERVKSITIDE